MKNTPRWHNGVLLDKYQNHPKEKHYISLSRPSARCRKPWDTATQPHSTKCEELHLRTMTINRVSNTLQQCKRAVLTKQQTKKFSTKTISTVKKALFTERFIRGFGQLIHLADKESNGRIMSASRDICSPALCRYVHCREPGFTTE